MALRRKKFDSFTDWAAHLRVIQRNRLPLLKQIILESVGEIVANEAKDEVIGRVSPLPPTGPFVGWEPLADSTIEQKTAMGWGKGGDARSILYATGEMMDSIEYRVVRNQAIIGSDDPVLQYHEYGTYKMPPRPVLGPSMIRSMPRIIPRIERALNSVMCGQTPGWR